MKGDGDPDEGVPVKTWQTLTPSWEPAWMDLQDKDTITLMEGEPGPLLNSNLTMDCQDPGTLLGETPLKKNDGSPPLTHC